MSNPASERRAHERFDHSLELETAHPGDGTRARLLTNNLSMGGLQCTSDVGFQEMSRLGVRLMLPENETMIPLDVEAIVVRSREVPLPGGDSQFELALLFNNMQDEHRERLQQFLGR
ncbi:hypothetical protein ABI59_15035 [Acidobacteria bacterium Mor1]|nr:hypothetical protein ABI59_15035 [Acidobacteria bacterium Mor1]